MVRPCVVATRAAAAAGAAAPSGRAARATGWPSARPPHALAGPRASAQARTVVHVDGQGFESMCAPIGGVGSSGVGGSRSTCLEKLARLGPGPQHSLDALEHAAEVRVPGHG